MSFYPYQRAGKDHGSQAGKYGMQFVLDGRVRHLLWGSRREEVACRGCPAQGVVRCCYPPLGQFLNQRPASQLVDPVGGVWVTVVSGGELFDLSPLEHSRLEGFTQYGAIEYVSKCNYTNSGGGYDSFKF